MKKLLIAAAAVAALYAAPASAAQVSADKPIQLAQADVQVRIGGDRGRSGVVVRSDNDRRWDGRRRGYNRGWRADCRMVTIRERRGNTVIVRKERRC